VKTTAFKIGATIKMLIKYQLKRLTNRTVGIFLEINKLSVNPQCIKISKKEELK